MEKNWRLGITFLLPEIKEHIQTVIVFLQIFNGLEGLDYQILLEADFLVNAYEDELPEEAVRTFGDKVFRTEAGRKMLAEMYLE